MTTVTYLVDDRDPDLKYLCSTTRVGNVHDLNNTFYEGTWSTIANDTDCSNGWFQYTFNGTAVDVPVTYSQPTTNYSLTLDGHEAVPLGSSFTDLSDEEHTIIYATAANASLTPTFDYLTVVAGTSTKMKGRNVILDDGDSAITYTGDGWLSTVLEPATFPNGRSAYKDTVHFTGQVGDSLTFEFPGASVFIYYMLPFSQNGSVTLSGLLESLGSTLDQTRFTFNGISNNDSNAVGVYEIGGLSGFFGQGMHRLTLNISETTDDYSIGFDFATYEAIFDSIEDMPSSNSGKSNKHVGAIVGGVIGGLAFVGLVILALFWWRRRRQHQGSRFVLTQKKPPHAGLGSSEPADSDMEKVLEPPKYS